MSLTPHSLNYGSATHRFTNHRILGWQEDGNTLALAVQIAVAELPDSGSSLTDELKSW